MSSSISVASVPFDVTGDGPTMSEPGLNKWEDEGLMKEWGRRPDPSDPADALEMPSPASMAQAWEQGLRGSGGSAEGAPRTAYDETEGLGSRTTTRGCLHEGSSWRGFRSKTATGLAEPLRAASMAWRGAVVRRRRESRPPSQQSRTGWMSRVPRFVGRL